MTVMLSGRCACGDVRYRLASAPMFVHCCHCLDCQRQTGSAFVLNAIIETDRIVLDGDATNHIVTVIRDGEPMDIPVRLGQS